MKTISFTDEKKIESIFFGASQHDSEFKNGIKVSE